MKKFFASVLACAMVAGMSVSSFALSAYNNDGDLKESSATSTGTTLERIRPDTTYWIPITSFGSNLVFENAKGETTATMTWSDAAAVNYLGDKDYFKVSFDKDGDGRSLIKSVSVVNDKKFSESDAASITTRTAWLKVVTNQSFLDSEKKAVIEMTIKPKKSVAVGKLSDSIYRGGILTQAPTKAIGTSDKEVIKLTFWVNNEIQYGDSLDIDEGEAFVFNPTDNEENTIIYGDDRAAIYFAANDDASKFYAKLSTKSHTDIYTKYGDPVDADLWFYDFVGNTSVPSTSRATLTLGIPWDTDKDYVPNPEDCFIYRLTTDNTLEPVSSFKYDEDNDDTTGIEGWTMRTRQLGTFVLSDTELELD